MTASFNCDQNSRLAAEAHRHITMSQDGLFKIEGSDLHFKFIQTRFPEWKNNIWKPAVCVDPGNDRMGFPHSRIMILTQGTHGFSPYLDLPYMCYFDNEKDKSKFSLFVREENINNVMPERVLFVGNPYKPKVISKEKIKEFGFDLTMPERNFCILTRYGTLRITIPTNLNSKTFEIKQNGETLSDRSMFVYIKEFNVIARAYLSPDNGSGEKIDIQGIFNVGNNFLYRTTVPLATVSRAVIEDNLPEYVSGIQVKPIVNLQYGCFDSNGLWVEQLRNYDSPRSVENAFYQFNPDLELQNGENNEKP